MVHVRVPGEVTVSFLWSRETAALFEHMVEADRARREHASREDQRDAGRDDQGENEAPEAEA